jgi:hypothetical protein
MSFTGNEDHDLPLEIASQWTANFRATVPSNATIATFYGKNAIQAILNQPDCVGIRIYYGLDGNNKKHLILVGADDSGNDLYEGLIAERGVECPTDCSTSNPLNS